MSTTSTDTRTKGAGRGFRSMSEAERKRVASLGGRAAHRIGTAHRWTSGPDGTAAIAGKKGGSISKRRGKKGA